MCNNLRSPSFRIAALCVLLLISLIPWAKVAAAEDANSRPEAFAKCRATSLYLASQNKQIYVPCWDETLPNLTQGGAVSLEAQTGTYAWGYPGQVGLGSPTNTMGASCNCAGDPITLATGNEFRDETDANLGSLGFHRYYNSDAAVVSGSVGDHWRHTFDRRMTSRRGYRALFFFRPDGKQVTFWGGGTQWAPEAGHHDTLSYQNHGYDYFEAATRHIEHYSEGGLLESIKDENGLITTLQYSDASTASNVAPASGLLIAVIDPKGRKLTFSYLSNASYGSYHVSSVTLPDGRTIGYDYTDDTAGASNLTKVTYADGHSQSYLYSNSDSTKYFPSALTGVVDESGVLYSEIGYDSLSRATSSHLADGADNTSVVYGQGTATVTYATGATTTITFQPMVSDVRASTVSAPCGTACMQPNASATYDGNGHPATATDFNGNVRTTTFDANGLLSQEIAATGSNNQRTTDTTWDSTLRLPLVRKVKDSSGKVVSEEGWAYNTAGQTTAQCLIDPATAPSYACSPSGAAPAGVRRTVMTYCTAVNATTCPLVGLLLKTDGPRTDVTDTLTNSYYPTTDESGCATAGGACHHLGDLKSTTDGAGLVTTYVSYDKAGRVTRMKDPNGVLTDYTYTARGWLATKTLRANASGAASTLDATTTIAYDPTGTVHSVTDADGVMTTYTYDAAHRLTDVTDGVGARIHYTLDNAGNRTAEQVLSPTGMVVRSLGRTFNALGQLTALTDGLNRTVFNAGFADSYDANGNLVHSQDGLSVQQKQVYDGLNRLVSTLRDYQGSNTATANSQSVSNFDALDRLTGFSDPDGLNTTYDIDALGNARGLHSPDTGTTSQTFDISGNPVTSVDAANVSTASTFDALGRLTARSYADTTLNVAYKFDEADSVTGCIGSVGKGRLTRIIEGNGGLVYCYDRRGNVVKKQQTVGTETRTNVYIWTPGNRLKSVTTANGTVVAYARDGAGRITSVTAAPSGGTKTTVASNFTYQPFGPVASYKLGNGQTVTRTFDATGQLTDIASTAFSLHLKRDAMGNVIALGNTAGVTTPAETYSYDALYRLTGVNTGDGTAVEAYTYNKTGDRLSKVAPGMLTGTYTYKVGTHQLTGVGTTTRQVDARGNTTANVLPSGTYGFGYNQRNRLTVVQNGGVTVGSYILNALGQRIQKTAGGVTTRFDYYKGSHLLAESTGTTTRDYVWMDDLPVGIVDNVGSASTVAFIHTDGLGSPRVVTDAAGTVLWQWAYVGNPFGEKAPVSVSGYMLNLRYPGQYFDLESGLAYNVYRDYEAAAGRYTQSDPIGLMGGASTYGYVRGNPLAAVDPVGLCDEDDRCRKVKADGIAECSGTFPNGRLDQSMIFFNCLNAYLEEHGCDPGGRPVPQPEESPAPAPDGPDPNAARRAVGWGLGAAVLYTFGALMFSTP